MAIQEELKVGSQPREEPAEIDEFYEDEPRRRPWAAIANVVLTLGLIFVGYQWHQSATHEQALASEVQALRADAESARLRSEEAQRQAADLQKRLVAVTNERTALEERIAALEKGGRERAATTAKEPARGAVTPVVTKKRR
jgi:uncharacterized protein HemX